jgi:FdhD protein
MGSEASSTTAWTTVRYTGEVATRVEDVLTSEGPVEFRLGGVPVAVLMRTPGRDKQLGLGFVISEGIVLGPQEVDEVRTVEGSENGDRYDIILAPGVEIDPEQFRRNVFASSSCGVCGKASIDAVLIACRTPPEFELTGALHAAGAFSPSGELIVLEEDVGRHNAVDKVIGSLAERRWPIGEVVLAVSGRIGFEITQKAAVAGIPFVAGVSGVSSLAAELGQQTGVTVIGFVRGDTFNVYAGAERVATK